MKRLLPLLIPLLVLAVPLAAQNNPYAIDDECYVYFQQAEQTVDDLSTSDFEQANEMLLQTALAKGDEKARTIYYVERQKRVSRRGQQAPAAERSSWNEAVQYAMNETCRVAQETGYRQYFYYAYELTQTYYFNTGQTITAISFLNQLMEQAKADEDAYGEWLCLRYLSSLYLRRSDAINAKKYLLQLIHIHETTDDELIRRQGIARQLMDLAETYPPGHDSVRICIQKAEKAALTHLDTLRVSYFQGLQAAWDRDLPTYRDKRDYCLQDRSFRFQMRSGEEVFTCIDHILAHQPVSSYRKQIDTIYFQHQRQFISSLAIREKEWEAASITLKRQVYQLQSDLSRMDQQNLGELSAHYGNIQLSSDLAAQSQKLARNTVFIAILLTLLLVGALIFTWIHLRNLKQLNRKDEQLIANLKEANEKVRLANDAKTRFVQNMSHEVRTPLNAIVGFSQLLALPDGSFPEEEKEEFADHIVNNTKMLTMLLDDILNASAMDSGTYRITYEDAECNFLCQAAISSAEHCLQPGVRLYYVPAQEEPLPIRTDPRRVQQILINLLTNACKHTLKGEIRLETSLTERPGYVTFSVTDTGIGVPPEKAEAIFNRFTKLDEFVQGTGLGLSICRDIATRMESFVYLDTSWTAGGARFVLQVPLKPSREDNTTKAS